MAEPSSKKGLIIGVAVLAAVIIIAAIAYNALAASGTPDQIVQTAASSSQRSTTVEDAQAPDFAMTSWNGEETSLSSREGKPVVLNFWASTCGPCQREMPEFQEAYEEYGEEVDFVILNVPDFNGETEQRARDLIEGNGYTFPVYFQVNGDASIKYGINSIPRTYFINRDGSIETYAAGAIDGETIARGISMILE